MPGKHRKRPKGPALEPVPSEILDHFVGQGPITAEELEATVRRFKKAVIERAMGGALTHHLGDPPGGTKPADTTNHRHGTSEKTVLTDDGPLTIDVPRDRERTFAPRLIGKHERRFTGFDDKIIAPSIPRPRCRPASCICCGTAWSMRLGRNASRWRPRCVRFTRRRAPTQR